MNNKPSMSQYVNMTQYDQAVKEWQENRIEDLEQQLSAANEQIERAKFCVKDMKKQADYWENKYKNSMFIQIPDKTSEATARIKELEAENEQLTNDLETMRLKMEQEREQKHLWRKQVKQSEADAIRKAVEYHINSGQLILCEEGEAISIDELRVYADSLKGVKGDA